MGLETLLELTRREATLAIGDDGDWTQFCYDADSRESSEKEIEMERPRSTALKARFRDVAGTSCGRLDFDGLFALLRKGQPDFPEAAARRLFKLVDCDESGFVSFDDIVDYLYRSNSPAALH